MPGPKAFPGQMPFLSLPEPAARQARRPLGLRCRGKEQRVDDERRLWKGPVLRDACSDDFRSLQVLLDQKTTKSLLRTTNREPPGPREDPAVRLSGRTETRFF